MKNSLDEMRRLRLLCENSNSDRGEGDMSSSIYGSSSSSPKVDSSTKKEKVEEEPAMPSTSVSKSNPKRKFTKSTNPGVKDSNASKVKELADKFFGKPYSQARIGADKDTRRYSYNFGINDFSRGMSIKDISSKDKKRMREFRDKFIALCEARGIPKGAVDVKFHIGSGLYASIQVRLGSKSNKVSESERRVDGKHCPACGRPLNKEKKCSRCDAPDDKHESAKKQSKEIDEAGSKRPTRPAQSHDSEAWGVRWLEFAGRECRATTKQKFFWTEAAMNKFIEKLENKDGFWKIDSYSYPEKKESIKKTDKNTEVDEDKHWSDPKYQNGVDKGVGGDYDEHPSYNMCPECEGLGCDHCNGSGEIMEAGVGIITKQNTTPDVKPGETARQAAKFGNKLGRVANINGKI